MFQNKYKKVSQQKTFFSTKFETLTLTSLNPICVTLAVFEMYLVQMEGLVELGNVTDLVFISERATDCILLFLPVCVLFCMVSVCQESLLLPRQAKAKTKGI